MFTTCKFELYGNRNIHLLLHDYLIFHQQNIAHDRKCVQYYSVRRAVIPFTDCDTDWRSEALMLTFHGQIWQDYKRIQAI